MRTLQLLHIDLSRPIRITSKGGKKYILVIVDHYSRLTWTFFLRFEEEIFHMFEAFARQMQVKYNEKIVRIRSNHGIEFENATFSQFCNDLGINHNFSTPRTP